MATKLKAPAGFTAMHAGETYKPDAQGVVTVPDSAVSTFKTHGCKDLNEQPVETNKAPQQFRK